MRKTLHVHRLELDHGHGGVIHQELEPFRGGNELSHAVAVLDEFGDPSFQPSHENLMRIHEALIYVVKHLIKHTDAPTSK